MSAQFSGSDVTDDRITLGAINVPAGTGAMTITSWALKTVNKDARILNKGSGEPTALHIWAMRLNPTGDMSWRLNTGASTDLIGGLVPNGTLHFWAMTYNGASKQNWLDGVLQATMAKTGTVTVNGNEAMIGNRSVALDRTWPGTIHEIRVYTRAVPQDQLETMFACRGTDNILDGLLWRWKLLENAPGVAVPGAGSPIRDVGLFGANGNGVNSPTWGEHLVRTRRRYH